MKSRVFSSCLVTIVAFTASGQDLLNDNIQFSGTTLELVEYVRLPTADKNIVSMATQPTTDDRLFVTASSGRIYTVEEGDGNKPRVWFDVADAVRKTTGRKFNFDDRDSGIHGGLRSLAFHPEFAANGKFYTSNMEDRPEDTTGHRYLGNSVSKVPADSVVVEWTYDHPVGEVMGDSYRELFRVNMPVNDHPIKQIKFNQLAEPGDEDYGLLYISHGDASVQSAIAGGGQLPDDAFGKVLRINPLQSRRAPYTTPGNPFVGDDSTLDEIYALGFRNPHNLSFAADENGNSHLIVADIGRDNIEEINIVTAGGNYGWSEREGTFIHRNEGGGSISGVKPLPANEALHGYSFPAAQIDHDAPPGVTFAGIAIAGAHVVNNGSALQGQYVFGDFGKSGRLYHVSFEEMLQAVTSLDPNDPSRNQPPELTQANVSQLRLDLDHDQNAATPAMSFDLFTDLLSDFRSDFRFGEGKRGELYVSSKRNGNVYLVTNSLPTTTYGDIVQDGVINEIDIDVLFANLGSNDPLLDINRDNEVNDWDVTVLVEDILGTWIGDSNLDGKVDFSDFVTLTRNFGLQGGWDSGDFDGNGIVDDRDFMLLSHNYGNTSSEQPVHNIPEPSSLTLLLIACCWLWRVQVLR